MGCGDGLLARDLHRSVPDVTAIDSDPGVLGRTRTLDPGVQHRRLLLWRYALNWRRPAEPA